MSHRTAIDLLRRALLANAAFSSVCALLLVPGASTFTEHLAIPAAGLVVLGVQLAVFAILLLGFALRPSLGRRRWTLVAAALVSLGDAGWVVASLASIGSVAWTRFGAVLVALTAVVVGALGATQAAAVVSLWRGRSDGAGEVHDPPSRARRHTAWALPVASGLALSGALYLLLPWADLRPVSLLHPDSLSRRQELTERGRRLLERSARAHGLEAISRKKTATVVATDEWPGGSPWWPVPAQRFEAVRRLGTFTSRVEILGGPRAGEIHGLQSWQPYRRAAGALSLEPVDSSPLASFYLPTLQYFDELPFRLLEAPIVVDAGPSDLSGKTFDRLFVTWGDEAPHARDDQYELWIDRDTHRIAKAYYTVREAPAFSPSLLAPLMRFAGVGTMHYSDYRDVDGVLVPFVQTVTLGSPEDHPSEAPGEFFHRLTVESIRFDAADPSALEPLPGLAPATDRKPRLEAPGRPALATPAA